MLNMGKAFCEDYYNFSENFTEALLIAAKYALRKICQNTGFLCLPYTIYYFAI